MAIEYSKHQRRDSRGGAPRSRQAEDARLRRTLAALDGAERPAIQPPRLPRGRAREKLARGSPLLDSETFDPDYPFCRRRFDRLIDALQRESERAAEQLELARAVDGGRVDFQRGVEEALADHADHLARLAAWAGLPPWSLAGVFELTVRPSLRALAEALAPLLAEVDCWQRAYCPLCGALPAQAELTAGEPGARLRCARCAAGWPVGTLRCWTCQAAVPGLAAAERLPGVDRRAQVCERCGAPLRLDFGLDPRRRADLATFDADRWSLGSGWPGSAPRGGYRLELGEPEVDEALEDLVESD
jgi:formate dehydrogenase maturation protein FdhE